MSNNLYDRHKISRGRLSLVGLILALVAVRLAHLWIIDQQLQQTAALYVGLPAVIAVVIALTATPQTLTGMLMTAVTIAIVLSMIVLHEGVVCLLMASPIFYLLAVLIGWAIGAVRQRAYNRRRDSVKLYSLVILPVLLLSLEGVHPRLTFERRGVVAVERLVQATPAQIEQVLGETPHFNQPLPPFLRLKFPAPLDNMGAGMGLAVGSQRSIPFAVDGQPMGELVLEIVERSATHLRFRPVRDSSPLAHWLRWEDSVVAWQPLDEKTTLVTWTLHYERRLDPAWYFGPLEQYGVYLTAGYLIDTLATP